MKKIILSDLLAAWKSRGFYLPCTSFNHEVFVVDSGDAGARPAETLLLLHGFPESSFSYSYALDLLLGRFRRVVAFDFPGFGFSAKPKRDYTYSIFEHADVALQVWKQLKITGGHVLSHDMGDSVLTEILARTNENKPGWFSDGFLTVTFTNGGMVRSKARFRIGQIALLSPLGKLFSVAMASYPIFRNQIKSANGNNLLKADQIRDMHCALRYNAWGRLFYRLISYQKERTRFEKSRWLPAVKECSVPVHICWGRDDRVNPFSIAQYLKEEVVPHAALTIVQRTGHFGQIHNPENWSRAVIEFWGKTNRK